jgi:hypothetical protein
VLHNRERVEICCQDMTSSLLDDLCLASMNSAAFKVYHLRMYLKDIKRRNSIMGIYKPEKRAVYNHLDRFQEEIVTRGHGH